MSDFIQMKVPNGKLLQLERINHQYRITGDFFCHPEDIIQEMENILMQAIPLEIKRNQLDTLFSYEENNIIGFSPADLINLYLKI